MRPIVLLILLLTFPVAFAQPQCSDGIDNDHDGLIDMDDPDCLTIYDPIEGECCIEIESSEYLSGMKANVFQQPFPLNLGVALSRIWPPKKISDTALAFKKSIPNINSLSIGMQIAFGIAGL